MSILNVCVPALSDKSVPNLRFSTSFCTFFCVFGNNKIEKAYGEVNTKKISLMSDLINAFPRGLCEAILYKPYQ